MQRNSLGNGMKKIQWGLDDTELYTPDEAVTLIQQSIGIEWTRRDLFKHSAASWLNFLCFVECVPVVKTEYKDSPYEDEYPCEFIKELTCWSGHCFAPEESITALARGKKPPKLTRINSLDKNIGCDVSYPIANLKWYINTYNPTLEEAGISAKDTDCEVITHFLNQSFESGDIEYMIAINGQHLGKKKTVEDDYWVTGDSLENYIFRHKNGYEAQSKILTEYGKAEPEPVIVNFQDNRQVSITQNNIHLTQNNSYTQTDIHQPPQETPQADAEAAQPPPKPRTEKSGIYIDFFDAFVKENQGNKHLPWNKNKALVNEMFSGVRNILPGGYDKNHDAIIKTDKDENNSLKKVATLTRSELEKKWSRHKKKFIEKYDLKV